LFIARTDECHDYGYDDCDADGGDSFYCLTGADIYISIHMDVEKNVNGILTF